MDPYDAIAHIRKRRRGAINARQLQYIESYKPNKRAASCCVIN
jgi:protein tyrosine phosphatase type 4A